MLGRWRVIRALMLTGLLATLGLGAFDGTVHAESYAEAMARVGVQLRSKVASERAAAVEAVAQTDSAQSVTLVFDMLAAETNADAGRAMGRALRHVKDAKALDAAEKRVLRLTAQNQAFQAYWSLLGLAEGQTAAGDAVIKKALAEAKPKTFWIRAAALEAIAEAARADLAPLVAEQIKQHSAEFEGEGAIVPVTACVAAGRLASGAQRFILVEALAEMLEKYKNERVRYHAAQACAQISGLKAFYDPHFWRDWVKMEGRIDTGKEQERRTASRKVPKFFDAEAVGRKVVFVIDVSGSMNTKVSIPAAPPKEAEKKGPVVTGKGGSKKDGDEKKDPPPPDYSKVKTKLDLAKVELIYTLEQLDETYEFNIVTYHNTHDYLIQKESRFVKATDANKKSFIDRVRGLTANGGTNIHGSLIRAFRTTATGMTKGDPALDSAAFAGGVETIFFLTDGFPNWSDTSTPADNRNRNAPTAAQADDFAKPEVISADIRRVNTFRKAVIHTVGIGRHAGGLLRELAENSGGTYRDMSGVSHDRD